METTEAATPDVPTAPEPGVTAHGHPSEGQYVAVAMVLAAVTALEVSVYYITALPHPVLIGMLVGMAITKFSLVALWFMHLRFDSRIFRRLFITGLALAIAVYAIFLVTLHVWE